VGVRGRGLWGMRGSGGGRGKKWPKHCMHIWINNNKKNERKNRKNNVAMKSVELAFGTHLQVSGVGLTPRWRNYVLWDVCARPMDFDYFTKVAMSVITLSPVLRPSKCSASFPNAYYFPSCFQVMHFMSRTLPKGTFFKSLTPQI
jgi:hypothetical protein